ncbi:MAG: hypothetical protein WBD31_00195 [Rubripirellula sp.]
MYFRGTLSVDPSSATQIELATPSKAFGKMVQFITLGLGSEKEERESFTAVGILQKFYRILASVGVSNIIRLSKDDIDFYLDEEGKENDLKEAMIAFTQAGTEQNNQTVFESLHLVLEHEDEELIYLIQIEINRCHKVGEAPIKLTINGVFGDLKVADQEVDETTAKLSPHFASQEKYDAMVAQKLSHFDGFLAKIESAIRQNMGVERIFKLSESKIIVPNEPIPSWNSLKRGRRRDYEDPVFHGYHGMDDYFFYAWFWADMCHDHQIQVADCTMVNDAGQAIVEVGEDAISVDQEDILSPATESADTSNGAIDPDAKTSFADVTEIETSKTSASSGGWFDSFADSFSGSDDSGGSSCGSSCGGGCGGD